jgi:hypothetical protein
VLEGGVEGLTQVEARLAEVPCDLERLEAENGVAQQPLLHLQVIEPSRKALLSRVRVQG